MWSATIASSTASPPDLNNVISFELGCIEYLPVSSSPSSARMSVFSIALSLIGMTISPYVEIACSRESTTRMDLLTSVVSTSLASGSAAPIAFTCEPFSTSSPLNRVVFGICPSLVELQGREPPLDDPHPTALSIPHPFAPEQLSPPQNSQRSESRSSSRCGSPQARLRSGNRIRGHQTLQWEERLLSSGR